MATPPAASRHHLTQTVLKALDVLECLAQSDVPLSAQDVALRTGLSRTTAYRLLTTMSARGYVVAGDDARFRLGAGLLRLATAVLEHLNLPEVAAPELHEVNRETGETTYLGILDQGEVLYVARVESPQPIRLHSVVGTRNPVHCTALGKALLAYLPPAESAVIVNAKPLAARTPSTIVEPERYMAHLQEVRARGYAIDDIENEEGVRCVAAPIFGHEGRPVAAISVAAPAYRMSLERVREISEIVRREAAKVSAKLGASAPACDSTPGTSTVA